MEMAFVATAFHGDGVAWRRSHGGEREDVTLVHVDAGLGRVEVGVVAVDVERRDAAGETRREETERRDAAGDAPLKPA